ncbi:MAG: hypothetical protein WD045_09905 [Pirellulaceae bacterium]
MCQATMHPEAARSPFHPCSHRYKRSRSSVNRLGLAGFVISLVGLVFTLGILSPLGLLLSFLGLFSRNRGFAIAGVVLGSIGTAIFALGLATIAWAASTVHHFSVEVPQIQATHVVLEEAFITVEEHRRAKGELPEGIEGNKLVLPHIDAWGNAVRYETEDNAHFAVRSAGADGKFDTTDDMIHSSSQPPRREVGVFETPKW